MPGMLIEGERRVLQDIEKRLTGLSRMLQQMTGTAQHAAWHIEDALWDGERLATSVLPRLVDVHVEEVHELLRASVALLRAVGEYEELIKPDEFQAALNALHNAGMLPPQEEPPACTDEGD